VVVGQLTADPRNYAGLASAARTDDRSAATRADGGEDRSFDSVLTCECVERDMRMPEIDELGLAEDALGAYVG
jgi:hypothetical protein